MNELFGKVSRKKGRRQKAEVGSRLEFFQPCHERSITIIITIIVTTAMLILVETRCPFQNG